MRDWCEPHLQECLGPPRPFWPEERPTIALARPGQRDRDPPGGSRQVLRSLGRSSTPLRTGTLGRTGRARRRVRG